MGKGFGCVGHVAGVHDLGLLPNIEHEGAHVVVIVAFAVVAAFAAQRHAAPAYQAQLQIGQPHIPRRFPRRRFTGGMEQKLQQPVVDRAPFRR